MLKIKAISIVLITTLIGGIILTTISLSKVESLGYSLLKINKISDWSSNRNSPIDGIVNIGNDLYEILKNHNVPLDQIKVESKLCDCFKISETITHSIIMTSPNSKLCIRLRFDPNLFKYHIIGYTGSIK